MSMRFGAEVQALSRQIELTMAYPLHTIQEDGGAVVILDQTKLPHETAFVRLTNLAEANRLPSSFSTTA